MASLRDALNQQHPELQRLGWKLLQPYRYADSDEDHIAALLDIAQFPIGATVLDVGCGVGECARLMHDQRPDLNFTLVNFSEAQLADCPPHFVTKLADAHRLPYGEERFDAVMFHHALGNMDWQVALAEACRVLKPGGILLVNEVERTAGDGSTMARQLSYRALSAQRFRDFADGLGMTECAHLLPEVKQEYLRGVWPESDITYDTVFDGTRAAVWRLVKGDKTTAAQRFGRIVAKHANIALQFSGGKDSMSCLYLLRPWLHRLTVYYGNTGDPIPESLEVIDACRKFIPRFIEVRSDVAAWRNTHGDPSDVVPTSATPLGMMMGFASQRISDRFTCCQQNVMLPMYRRMQADNVTCIVRGQKLCDMPTVPLKSGDVFGGFEFFYPIEDWSHEDVLAYLEQVEAPVHPCYAHGTSGVDCLHCTAWWDESHLPFIKERHPAAYMVVSAKIKHIRHSINTHLADLENHRDIRK